VNDVLDFMGRHGLSVVYLSVLLDQLGLPIPTIPILLGLGALAGSGHIHPVGGLLAALAGSLCADCVWFELGRRKGSRVLGWLCRIALEPDSCVSKTRDLFARHGVKSLLVAKFVPGFDTVAPPLAGLLGVRVLPFVLWSTAGALLWLVAFGGLGYLFSDRLDAMAAAADRLGGLLVVLLVGLAAAYLAWKYHARQRVLRDLRMAQITPAELHAMIGEGRRPVIVDARNEPAVDALPFVIEGALSLTVEQVELRHGEIARDQEVVVYCSCPNEVSAARVALKLKRFGIERVRPLTGGIEAWRELNLPLVPRMKS
jgi:membrane protein DedA with SNARE-associated domain/rhodanese-related sulfurtransferase